MQNPPRRVQPLTFSHVSHRAGGSAEEAAWRREESSDSDSGITEDSHSPPTSKTTPDSGIGNDQPAWNLSPPPPPPPSHPPHHSLLFYSGEDLPTPTPTPISMSGGRSGSKSGTRQAVSDSSKERQRQQQQQQQQQQQEQYVLRSTLLEYERQRKTGKGEEVGGGGQYVVDRTLPERSPASSSHHSSTTPPFHPPSRSTPSPRQNVANDYVPCRKPEQRDAVIADSGGGGGGGGGALPRSGHASYPELSERFSCPAAGEGGEFYPAGDEGYNTDSRSNTTAGSLASPLSSSLSSLTTDSSCSLNGSQRGLGAGTGMAGGGGGSGSGNGGGGGSGGSVVKAQPVSGAGRLVIGKRGMLVKRRDLPPVERTDAVTLEDRLRALTTIQEEDPSAAGSPNKRQTPSPPANQRKDQGAPRAYGKADRSDPEGQGSRSGSAGFKDDQTSPEGLYSVIAKQPSQLRASSRRGARADSDSNLGPASLHRAVPVTLRPQGESTVTHRSGPGGGGEPQSSSETALASAESQGPSEVRFKAGGGGVKLTQSGQFEIDYSYYMKASPSESNDEINTYSPTTTPRHAFFEDVSERDSTPTWRRGIAQNTDTFQPPLPQDCTAHSDFDGYHGENDFVESEMREAPNSFPQSGAGTAHDSNYSEESEHVYMNVGDCDLMVQQPSSLPANLNSTYPPLPQPQHCRRHSDSDPPLEHQRFPETDCGGSIPRRNASGHSSRTSAQGDRTSCDVDSLYRQGDLSHTFPPPSASSLSSSFPQGVAADRLSLNLGDLPRIHEQLRATSEMLLSSSGKRHQFASSSDIYRLFQGQHGRPRSAGGGGGFGRGRLPAHRRSFNDLKTSSPRLQSLAEVKSRVKANASPRTGGADQSQSSTSSSFSPRQSSIPGPLRANHDIYVPENIASSRHSGSGRDRVSIRASSSFHPGPNREGNTAPPAGVVGGSLQDRLDRGQQFSTDVIQSEEGEQLSTLV